MEKSHIDTTKFELDVDDRSDYTERCLAAIVVLLGELVTAQQELIKYCKEN